jgi:histidinol-phosphatase (PHP family)
MVLAAIDAGAEYIALTDPEDLYFAYCPRWKKMAKGFGTIDKDRHFAEILPLKEKYAGQIKVAVGAEFGYAEEAVADYSEIAKLPLDVIINSVHSAGHKDIYYPEFYEGRTKKQAYAEYLREILKSVNAPYGWDVLGHLGYIERKAPYADVRLTFDGFPELLDEILKVLITGGKALEINSQTKGSGYALIPDDSVLKRYRELGGELITFGSDAHTKDRIGEKYADFIELATRIGFKYVAGYAGRKPVFTKL